MYQQETILLKNTQIRTMVEELSLKIAFPRYRWVLVEEWLETEIGNKGLRYLGSYTWSLEINWKWFIWHRNIFFNHEADMLLFKMKWF